MVSRIVSLVSCAAVVFLAGCAALPRPPARIDAGPGTFSQYAGPRARISVGDFEAKAPKANGAIGAGLKDMLVAALTRSNRFVVVERPVPGQDKPPAKPADIVIAAQVSEFEPQASGGAAGIGGGGGVGSGTLESFLGSATNKAYLALDIRIVDAATSKVLGTTRVQGQASDVAGGFMTGFYGGWSPGSGLSGYVNTPMEKAIRIGMVEATRYISQAVPSDYYKYSQ